MTEDAAAIAAGQSQSVTYSAPFTFPWLETDVSHGSAGVSFTAGKHGMRSLHKCCCVPAIWVHFDLLVGGSASSSLPDVGAALLGLCLILSWTESRNI